MTQSPNSYTFHTKEGSLMWRLADYSDLIQRNSNNTLTVLDHIPLHYDTYGILDKRDMFKQLLGSVATEYHWQGSYIGPHHLMWPRREYQSRTNMGMYTIRNQFRESPTLKVILPRELHDYLHRVTEPPQMPHIDVMAQYVREQSQVSQLYSCVNKNNFRNYNVSDDKKEQLRMDQFQARLATMQDAQVGLMPDRQMLASMSLPEARRMLRHLALPLGISAAKACQQVFFADPYAP